MPHRRLAACTALALTVAALTLTTSHSARADEVQAGHGKARFCHGHRATIVGTPYNDQLHGTRHRDVIVGLDGKDHLYGKGGNDVICGNGDQDVIVSGAGDDLIDGGTEHDELRAGPGDDRVYGGNGRGDYFVSDRGDDLWVTGIRNTTGYLSRDRFEFDFRATVDLPRGVAYGPHLGHDTLRIHDLSKGIVMYGSSGRDHVTGGPGPDYYLDNAGPDYVDLGDGNDSIRHGQNYYNRGGFSVLIGGPGNDFISAGEDEDAAGVVDGGAGNDTFWLSGTLDADAGPGNDKVQFTAYPPYDQTRITAGDGNDTLTLIPQDWNDNPDATFVVDLGLGTFGWSGGVTIPATGFENATVDRTFGPNLPTVMRGTEEANVLRFITDWYPDPSPVQMFGLGGDDSLQSSDGDDLLDGGAGQDKGDGGTGNDTCVSIEGPLVLSGPTCEITQP